MLLATLMLLQTAPAVQDVPTAQVQAVGETMAVASLEDAADDPAIWRNARDPRQSLIVATDKKAGLNVYDLSGKLRSTLQAGRVNNVDLRSWGGQVIVAASDRNDKANAKLALYTLDTKAAKLTEIGRFEAGAGEAYGLCMYAPRGGKLYAFVVHKAGTIVQMEILSEGGAIKADRVRTMKLATQSEGCVADDRTGLLYVGEEDVGVWRFGANPRDALGGEKVIAADGKTLVADVEGVAIAAQGTRGGYLVVSSQGDSAYGLWRLPDLAYAGRFRITAGKFGATSETDGIEVSTAGFGPGLQGGLMLAQDGDNAPAAQNFKLVRWADVRKALRLK
ncbi:3-phytase [Sphingomonas kyeonggiensis]|uniref:3-phytase n=1 Tax=Sphingomonas kyeonggiensis TaxID=1268553 RepID=A0A7W7NTS5_9SPHN|nr:phytase [Sphingomonas kyeonggiensis]MBB4840049.1 3-phytase [Sphingomonas kyeonggiensis]